MNEVRNEYLQEETLRNPDIATWHQAVQLTTLPTDLGR
jgi:hypothetical protein